MAMDTWVEADPDLSRKINELNEVDEGLSRWEVNFVDDMGNRLKGGLKFSSKQIETIHTLHQRFC